MTPLFISKNPVRAFATAGAQRPGAQDPARRDIEGKRLVMPGYRSGLMAVLVLGLWGGLCGPGAAQDVSLEPSEATEAQVRSSETGAEVADEAVRAATAAAEPASQARPAKPRQARRPAPAGFVLRNIAFPDSAYLEPGELLAVEAGLRGQRIVTPASVAAAVNALYRSKGIVTAEALVKSVDPRRGTVELELLEARVGRIRSEGLMSEAYIAFRLGLGQNALADNRVIEDRLLRFRLTEGMPLQIGFAPGAAYGQTDVIIAQPDLPRHATIVTLNNYGSPSEGEAQAVVSHTIRSLTGWNDPLFLTATLREGGASVLLGYSRVITPGGGTLGLTLSASETETIRAPRLDGREHEIALSYTHPVIVEENRRLSFSAGLSVYRETSDLLGVRTLDHRGREISLGAAYFQRGEGWSVSAAPRLMFGRYDDRVLGRNDRDYSALQLTGFLSVALGADLVGSATLGAQRALSGVLPSQRKFTVTSPSGVRGYPASLSSGDSGYYLRMQLEHARGFDVGGKLTLRPFGFVDLGEAFDSTDRGLGLASSAGLGISFGSGRVFGDLYVAKPLTTNIAGWTNRSDDPMIGISASMTF